MLFEKGNSHSVGPTELADMGQLEFQRPLPYREIPIHYDAEELEEDLRDARSTSRTIVIVSDTSPVLALAAYC